MRVVTYCQVVEMRSLIKLLMILLSGCASTGTAPNFDRIELGTQTPGPAYVLISAIEGSDGEGCGITKKWGRRELAVDQLKIKAAQMGADFILITEEIQPHREGSCRVNTYQIKGQAYRRRVAAP